MNTVALRKLGLGSAAAMGLMAAGSIAPAHATPVVWDFSNPSGNLGTTHTYASTPAVTPAQNIIATGYHQNGNSSNYSTTALFGKNAGSGEQGLGLANDPSGKDEITAGNFVQLDLGSLSSPPLNSLHFSFQANSTTDGETWRVYGTNTAGSLSGATIIASGTNNNLISDLGPSILGTYRYLDVTAVGSGNVLVRELDNSVNSSVPEPASIALLGTGLLAAGMIRRRGKRS